MMLSDPRGAAHAVFTWRLRQNLRGEKAMVIDDAVLGSLPGRALGEALVDSFVSLARQHNCNVIEIDLPEHFSGIRGESLVARGFRRVPGSRLLAKVDTV